MTKIYKKISFGLICLIATSSLCLGVINFYFSFEFMFVGNYIFGMITFWFGIFLFCSGLLMLFGGIKE